MKISETSKTVNDATYSGTYVTHFSDMILTFAV